MKLEQIEPHFKTSISDGISDAEKTRAEFETVSKLSHPNILRLLHVFRYQKNKKCQSAPFVQHWTVIMMAKHEKNIGELETGERIHILGLLRDVLG